MTRKPISLLLAAALFCTLVTVQQASAADSDSEKATAKQNKLSEKVKTGVSKLGVGSDARVEVKLRDHAKLAGFISEAGPDSFVITDPKTGVKTPVLYADVTQVKGHNLSTGAKVAIGIAIGAGIVLIILAIYLNCCTG